MLVIVKNTSSPHGLVMKGRNKKSSFLFFLFSDMVYHVRILMEGKKIDILEARIMQVKLERRHGTAAM